jgi:hypothetical protein
MQTELAEVLAEHLSVLPQVQRQLDRVGASLYMCTYMHYICIFIYIYYIVYIMYIYHKFICVCVCVCVCV